MKYFAKLIEGKLFLCSRDIQVGDKVLSTKRTGEETVEEFLEGGYIKTNASRLNNLWNLFKVIGEILTPDIKEGQEFTEEEVEFLGYFH